MASKTELAWLAGFFDGEGCFSMGYKDSNKRYYTLSADIVQAHLATLEECQRITGFGKIYSAKSQQRTATAKQTWTWYVKGPQAKLLAAMLLPYLVRKRGHAEIVSKYPILPIGGTRDAGSSRYPLSRIAQAAAFVRIRELNQKGPS
jgi:hypothetical protein